MGRSFHHLFVGIIFVFFDHPFDAGDLVKIYDFRGRSSVLCVVKRQSLIYTVFQRVDNNVDLQISNEELYRRHTENVSRSDLNKQKITLYIDFRTSFKDLDKLRSTMDTFVKENSQDFVPGSFGLSVTSLHELNKMELRVSFVHKNNWSDDKLRARRSNKFHCALVAACRMIPLYGPGGMTPIAGESGNPLYTAQIPAPEANEGILKEYKRRQEMRWDTEGSKDGIKLDEAADAVIMRDATEREESDAYYRISRANVPGTRDAASSGVEMPRTTTGLRMAAIRREDV